MRITEYVWNIPVDSPEFLTQKQSSRKTHPAKYGLDLRAGFTNKFNQYDCGIMNETLSIEEAKAIIEPFYDLFRHDKRDWEKGFAVLDDAWRSYYTTTEYRTKQETQPYIEGLFDMVPDIYVDIKDVHLAGDVVAVRSELSGTPKADFMVPHSGQSFKIMTIDLNRIKDGKIVELYHLEDWGTAIKQLSAKE